MRLSEKIRRELGRLSGTYSGNDAALDEMNAILLQLTIALMMIFLIAFMLFRIKTTEELEPMLQVRAEQHLNFQRQELIMALERTEEYYHIRYGLKSFAKVDEYEQVIYDISPIITDGKISGEVRLRTNYADGMRNAVEDYTNLDSLLEAWFARTLLEAGIDNESFQEGNEDWLLLQIGTKIDQVRRGVSDLQFQGAALIQAHLAAHPEEVQDLGVKSLLEQYMASPPETQAILLTELDNSLRSYAYNQLKAITGAPLIREVTDE